MIRWCIRVRGQGATLFDALAAMSWMALGVAALAQVGLVPSPAAWGWSCPFKALVGGPCLGCGGTRSFLLLVEGRLVDAVAMSPLGAVVGLGAMVLALWWPISLVTGRMYPWMELSSQGALVLRWLVGLALAAHWAWLWVWGGA